MLAPRAPHPEIKRHGQARLLNLGQRWAALLHSKAPASPLTERVKPEEALGEDEFQRAKQPYAAIETVTPIFSADLSRAIQAAIQLYECETGRLIPPAYRFPKQDFPGQWASNKPERLTPVVWVLAQLPPAESDKEAINQLAAVLDVVDGLAQRRYAQVAHLYLPDPRPLRLTLPLPETVRQKRILVSLGIRHVTLFQPDGAIQIQHLPLQPEKLNYPQRAENPDSVFFTKPGESGKIFWP